MEGIKLLYKFILKYNLYNDFMFFIVILFIKSKFVNNVICKVNLIGK